MAHSIIARVSQLLKHAVGVLLLAWLRALRAGAIAALLGVVVVEVGAVVVTHHFPPGGTVQLVAVALGGALAYGAAVTVVASELIIGIGDAIGILMGEAEAGARAAAAVAEREVGEASGGALRAVGLGALLGEAARAGRSSPGGATQRPVAAVPPAPPAAPAAAAAPPAPAPSARAAPAARPAEAATATTETLAELASGAEVPSSRPRVDAGPVPAGQLPRIAWIDEQPTIPLTPVAAPEPDPAAVIPDESTGAPDESAATPVPALEAADVRDELPDVGEQITLPLAGPMAQQPYMAEPSAPAAAVVEPGESQAGAAGVELAEPTEWHDDHAEQPGPEQWHDPSHDVAPEEEEAGIQPVDLFGALPPSAAESRSPDSHTRPLPETTRPLDTASALPARRGSVWEHISQVLAGRPVEPLPADDRDAAEPDPSSGDSTPPVV